MRMKSQNEKRLLLGLPPLACADSKVLILGSMPGKQSLENQRYYDYPYNRFWKIIFRLAEEEYSADYEVKKRMLEKCRIALWDAIDSCERENSSLDSKIKNAKANNIESFLNDYPSIKYVVTNGRTSEKYLTKYNPNVKHIYLPSTSPATASVKNVDELWLKTLKELLNDF